MILEFREIERNMREKLNMTVKLCGLGCNLSLVRPSVFLNLTRFKRCLMFGNYLWIPVLGKSWDNGTRGKRTGTKNHQDHSWCYITFVRIFKRYHFGTGWMLCVKERHWIPKAIGVLLIPQHQANSFEGRAEHWWVAGLTHLPGWAASAQGDKAAPAMRKYALAFTGCRPFFDAQRSLMLFSRRSRFCLTNSIIPIYLETL